MYRIRVLDRLFLLCSVPSERGFFQASIFSIKNKYKSGVNLGITSMGSLLNSILRVGSINAHCKCQKKNQYCPRTDIFSPVNSSLNASSPS